MVLHPTMDPVVKQGPAENCPSEIVHDLTLLVKVAEVSPSSFQFFVLVLMTNTSGEDYTPRSFALLAASLIMRVIDW